MPSAIVALTGSPSSGQASAAVMTGDRVIRSSPFLGPRCTRARKYEVSPSVRPISPLAPRTPSVWGVIGAGHHTPTLRRIVAQSRTSATMHFKRFISSGESA